MRRVIGRHQGLLLLIFGFAVSVHTAAASETSAGGRSVLFLAQTSNPGSPGTDKLQGFGDAGLGAVEAQSGSPSQFFKRLFSALRPFAKKAAGADLNPSQIITAAIPERNIMVADADPNFGKWQDQANDRLKQEKSVLTPHEHPLAAANPGSFVIVCEAGCRGAPEQIVYQVVRSEAATLAPRQYVPTDASQQGAATSEAAVATQDPNTIQCLAGCYDSPKVHRARQASRAVTPKAEAVPVKAASLKKRGPQICRNGAIVGPDPASKHAAVRNAITRTIASRLGAVTGWRTSVKKVAAPGDSKPVHAATLKAAPRRKGIASKVTALKVRRLSKSMTLARVVATTRR